MTGPDVVASAIPTDTAWMDAAACYGMDTDMFFPVESTTIPDVVRETCRGCPVRERCLDWAITVGERGVWAGTSSKQRTKIRRDRMRLAGTLRGSRAS